jgi:mRNA interferase MazF
VWLAALDPVQAGEQGGTRPVLVVSASSFNAWPVGLVIVVPITTRDRGFAHHVPVTAHGLDRASFAMPEYVRSIVQRRLQRRLARADSDTVRQVGEWLRRLTG